MKSPSPGVEALTLYFCLGNAFNVCFYHNFIVLCDLYHFAPLIKVRAPFTIVRTTTILADALRAIVGEHAKVISLMGPGVDPHLYRAREGDLHKLAHGSPFSIMASILRVN